MNGDIKFTPETTQAMIALLRFIDNVEYFDWDENKPLPGNHKERILYFKKYITENSLKSKVITPCKCTSDISIRETVFNVCLECKGVVSEDFMSHPSQDGNMVTARVGK